MLSVHYCSSRVLSTRWCHTVIVSRLLVLSLFDSSSVIVSGVWRGHTAVLLKAVKKKFNGRLESICKKACLNYLYVHKFGSLTQQLHV